MHYPCAIVVGMAEIYSGASFRDEFDPRVYLEQRRKLSNGRVQYYLRCYHDAFQSLPQGSKVLDYGSGPSILATISATTKASEIVLSDYTEKNRDTLKKWLMKDPEAFNWSPHFSYVVEKLENKSKEEAEEREEQARRLVKAVVHCDIRESPPIESDYSKEYDIVICSLVLENTSTTRYEYKTGMAKLGALVKPGGVLLFTGAEHRGERSVYTVGDATFNYLGTTVDFVTEAMTSAGFDIISVDKYELSNHFDPDVVGFMFMKATKAMPIS